MSVLLRLSTAAVADASGERRSWLTAASSAVRSRSASASGLAAAAASASSLLREHDAGLDPKTASSRWSAAVQRMAAHARVTWSSPPAPARRRPAATPARRPHRRLDDVPVGRRRPASRSSSVTDDSDSASRSRSSSARSAFSPRSTLPATVARTRDSAWARAAWRGAPGREVDDALTAAATTTNADQRDDVVVLGDREPMDRRREVVVEQQARDDRRGDRPGRRRRRARRRRPRRGNSSRSLVRLRSARSGASSRRQQRQQDGRQRRRPATAAVASARRSSRAAPGRGPSRSWVTMWTSMSPDSRTVSLPIPAPVSSRDRCERRDAPSTSWVAFCARANSISDAEMLSPTISW